MDDDPVVVTLDELTRAVPVGDGVHWGIETTDLDVNLVHLDPLSRVETHLNLEVDVVIVVLEGSGWTWLGDDEHRLGPHVLVLAPRGIARSVAAGPDGITYVSMHRRRSPLGVHLASRNERRSERVDEAPDAESLCAHFPASSGKSDESSSAPTIAPSSSMTESPADPTSTRAP
jgi:quercetin dioxygenase-like cupin family protein